MKRSCRYSRVHVTQIYSDDKDLASSDCKSYYFKVQGFLSFLLLVKILLYLHVLVSKFKE